MERSRAATSSSSSTASKWPDGGITCSAPRPRKGRLNSPEAWLSDAMCRIESRGESSLTSA